VFFEPGQTPFDLNFSLFGIRVRVSPWFWVISALLIWQPARAGVAYLFVGILCIFFSILLHELGHVLTGKLFGADGHIVLYSFGGLAIGSNDVPHRWQRIAVSSAGPLIQLLLYGLIELCDSQGWIPNTISRLQLFALDVLVFVNLIWALMNLLPVWPLDGGMISREILTGINPGQGMRWSLGLSVACAGFLAVNSLLPMLHVRPLIPYFVGGVWTMILFASLAISSYQMLQQLGPPSRPRGRYEWDESEHPSWERDPDYWKR
jgi:Zn-dependent protease